MIELRFYVLEDGSSPFEEWFAELDGVAAAKVTVALARLEQGNFSSAKPVGGGVIEYRIDWGPGIRVYFGREGDQMIILLAGGSKRRQQKDIESAKRRWADYLRRSRKR